MNSMAPVHTVSDLFDCLYRIYSEDNGYTVVIHRPNGDAFSIRRKRWRTLWGTRRWISRSMSAFEGLRRRITSGDTTLEPGVWDRMSSLGLEFMYRSTQAEGRPSLCRTSCRRTPATWTPSRGQVRPWWTPISSSAKWSHRVDSMRASPRVR